VKTQVHSTELIDDPELRQVLTTAVRDAARLTLDRWNEYGPVGEEGYQMYAHAVGRVRRVLSEYGFSKVDEGCQARMEFVGERFGHPTRITFCKGSHDNASEYVRVNKKGRLTEVLVSENGAHALQQQLPGFEEGKETASEEEFLNYILFWQIVNRGSARVLRLHIGLPEWIGTSGRLLKCSRIRLLYEGPIAESGPLPEHLPEAADVTPLITERKGE
jgi:hypothetical protein